jgi:hypothetical protein
MVLLLFALFRAGFEPLSWDRDHGLSVRIEGRLVFLGGITTNAVAQNRRSWRGKGTEPWARRVFRLPFTGSYAFSPIVPPPCHRCAHRPIRVLATHAAPEHNHSLCPKIRLRWRGLRL